MILLDPRFGKTKTASRAERASAFKETLEGCGVPVELAQMEFGDASFMGNGEDGPVSIGIEIKATQDLVNSMASGRLAGHQIPGLLDHYQHVWLVVEGISRRGKGGGLEIPRGNGWTQLALGKRPLFWDDVEKFLVTLEVQAGLRVRRARTTAETAHEIAALYQWWQKDWKQHKGLAVTYTPPLPMRPRRTDDVTAQIQKLAAAVDGIGHDRSWKIAEAFESPEDLWMAGESVWEEIPGIGKGMAKKIVAALHARKL